MSEIRATTISDLAGTGPATLTGQYAAKAWVSFVGSSGAIGASENVTSVTDNGTGNYTVNFTNAFANANYNYAGGCGVSDMGSVDAITIRFNSSTSTSSQQIRTLYTGASGNAYADLVTTTYVAHGDLA
jgi:hypothetical protein